MVLIDSLAMLPYPGYRPRCFAGPSSQAHEAADLAQGVEAGEVLADQRVVVGPGSAGDLAEQGGRAGGGAGPARPAPGPGTDESPTRRGRSPAIEPGTPPPAAATPRTEPRPLEGEGGVGDGPPVVGSADDGGVADPGLVDEHLVEQGPTGHLPQRPYLDARLLHVEGEIGDPLVLGHVGVGASQQHGEIGDLTARGPHLLSGDHPSSPSRPRVCSPARSEPALGSLKSWHHASWPVTMARM